MVQQSLFGIDAREDGLHVEPFLPAQLRDTYFPGSRNAALKGIDYRGHTLDIALDLPAGRADDGAYEVRSLTLNRRAAPRRFRDHRGHARRRHLHSHRRAG